MAVLTLQASGAYLSFSQSRGGPVRVMVARLTAAGTDLN
jgi:hypothetical protein